MLDRVDLGDVLVRAAGAELLIDSMSIAVTEGRDDVVRGTVRQCHVNALKIGAPFEEVRIKEVRIE